MKDWYSLEEIREHVEGLQFYDPENEIYAGILDSLDTEVFTDHIMQHISLFPWYFIPNFKELQEESPSSSSRIVYINGERFSIFW